MRWQNVTSSSALIGKSVASTDPVTIIVDDRNLTVPIVNTPLGQVCSASTGNANQVVNVVIPTAPVHRVTGTDRVSVWQQHLTRGRIPLRRCWPNNRVTLAHLIECDEQAVSFDLENASYLRIFAVGGGRVEVHQHRSIKTR